MKKTITEVITEKNNNISFTLVHKDGKFHMLELVQGISKTSGTFLALYTKSEVDSLLVLAGIIKENL